MNEEMKLELINPDKASKWLNANTSNRKLRAGVAEKYADDMRKGLWTRCVDPIVFYEDGALADGQHRLWAIVESGNPQKMYVLRGLQREAGLNIDTGLGRSLVDNARIMDPEGNLSNELIAVTIAIERGKRSSGNTGVLSNAARLALVHKHETAARWAIAHGPRTKKIRSAPVLAAMARAYCVEKASERLAEFGRIMSSGMGNGDQDSAAISLRNALLSGTITPHTAGGWRDLFLKTQNAIRHFMRRKKLYLLRATEEEIYPLQGKPEAELKPPSARLRKASEASGARAAV